MPRIPDLVLDSRLRTRFRDSIITHSYLEIDSAGRRFSREEHWISERIIGRGGFGQVRLERCIAKDAKQDSLRAVKAINKPFNPSESFDFNRELEAIAKFSNDRYRRWFVKSFGWFEDPNSIYITMEYCRHGDLHHYLISQRVVPTEEVQQLTYQILEGLDQMHQNDFAHRDLKPGNILIKSMPPEEKWWIVLTDFGISKRADENNGPTTTIKGTLPYMAPELLGFLNQVKPRSIADFKAADMWALGEIVFQMLTGENTFQNYIELITYCRGQQEFPSNRLPISAGDGHEFVTRVMMALPHGRMTTTQSLQHQWMRSLNVSEEFATLNLEQTRPLVSEISPIGPASAAWSDLSSLEYRPTQTAMQLKSTGPSHDSTPMATASADQTVQIWDASSGECLQTLKEHSFPVYSLAFSPIYSQLASGSTDAKIKIWDIISDKCLLTLDASSCVRSVAFSHDSALLASGLYNKKIEIWDASSGMCLRTLEGHSEIITSVAFSHDTTQLASGSYDCTIKIWDVSSGECLRTLKGHIEWVNSVVFSHNSTRLASGSDDSTIKIWDMSSGECLRTLKGHGAAIKSVAFSHDSTRLASGSSSYTIKIFDVSSGECLQTLEGHSKWINSVAFSHNSAWLVSGSGDHTIKVWDASSGKCFQTLKGHSNQVMSVAFSHDSTLLASGSIDKTIRIWSAFGRS